jgi:hypothetical protein
MTERITSIGWKRLAELKTINHAVNCIARMPNSYLAFNGKTKDNIEYKKLN